MTIGIAFVISFMALTIFNLGTQKDIKSSLLFLLIAIGLWAGLVGEVHTTLSAFLEEKDALGVEQNESQSPATIDFYKMTTAWGIDNPVTARVFSSNFIFMETRKVEEFNNAVNIPTVIKVWTEEYPLDSLYFGNMFRDLEFEIIVFDVDWKDAEFDQFSKLSLEDKADFEESSIVKGSNIARGPKILSLTKSSPRVISLRRI